MRGVDSSKSADPIQESVARDLLTIRDEIVNQTLLTVFFITPFAMLLTLPRLLEFGLDSPWDISNMATISIAITTLFRKRLPFTFKTYFLLLLMLLIGLSALLKFGLIGMYAIFFMTATFYAALLGDFRTGVLAIFSTTIMILSVYLLVRSGVVTYDVDYQKFIMSPSTWLAASACIALFAVIILRGFAKLHGKLLENVVIARQRTEEVELVNARLEEEIVERKVADARIRDSEERYRLLAENVSDCIWTMGLDFKFRYLSPSARELLGYSPEEFQTMKLSGFLSGKQIQEIQELARMGLEALEQGKREEGLTRTLEFELTRKDGNKVWTETSTKIILDENETPSYLLGVTRDISARKRLEEQFLQSQKMEAVGRLAGGIAHDFNNQLTVIMNLAEMLSGEFPEGDKRQKRLQMIATAGEKSAGLTKQLLAFSRQQAITPTLVDLSDSVNELKKMLARMIGEDIDLQVHAEEKNAYVLIDPVHFEQIIFNLVVNARDALPRGGKITVEIKRTVLDEEFAVTHLNTRPGEYILVSVSDNGVGMDQDTLSHIFEPFFTTKGVDKGTGLGLATVYGIVTQVRGAVYVYSEPGIGTSFSIYLPAAADIGSRSIHSVKPLPHAPGQGTILLVEDEEMVRDTIVAMLSRSGYSIRTARDAAEALAFLGDPVFVEAVDLLMTDMIMPGMGGKDLAQEIQKIKPGVRVLFMSGYTDDFVGSDRFISQDTHFIQKPFTRNDLLNKVKEAISR